MPTGAEASRPAMPQRTRGIWHRVDVNRLGGLARLAARASTNP